MKKRDPKKRLQTLGYLKKWLIEPEKSLETEILKLRHIKKQLKKLIRKLKKEK